MQSTVDLDLLMELQYNFPLCERPFRRIAERLGLEEDYVISRVRELVNRRVIKRIGAVLNYQSRGLKAALVALTVPDRLVDDVAHRINIELGVSHNYLRIHSRFNIWFVIKRRSIEEIIDTVKKICQYYNITDYVILATVKTYRLDVKFNLYRGISEAKILKLPDSVPSLESVSKLSSRVLSKLYNIDICSEPFTNICKSEGVDTGYLLQEIKKLINLGVLRDFYAVLNQYNIGFLYNAMIRICDECSDSILLMREPTHIVYRDVVYGTSNYGRGCYLVIHAVSEDIINEFVEMLRRRYGYSEIEVIYSFKDLLGGVKHDVEYM